MWTVWLDANSGAPIALVAYGASNLRALLDRCGFSHIKFHPSLASGENERDLFPIVACKE